MISDAVISVDDLQFRIDKLMLTIFEAVRNEQNINISESDGGNIKIEYDIALSSIENLVAVDTNRNTQETRMEHLSNEINLSQQRILELENKIILLKQNIDGELVEVISRMMNTFIPISDNIYRH